MTDAWIGVDLDGTLAVYDGWHGESHIGAPVPKMVRRVQHWLEEGIQVRIFTARVSPSNPHHAQAREAIEEWCAHIFGTVLPITCEKDYSMIELWDDRAIAVIPNTGERVDGGE